MTKIEIQNVGQPGKTYSVDADKFTEMRRAVLLYLPNRQPGMTPSTLIAAVTPLLSVDLFPGGKTSGWWVKAVQLDLEAKAIIKRADKAPVRLWRV
ncbi:MAG: hypothetical protein RIR95_1970 [Pseudomonadota bacterium]